MAKYYFGNHKAVVYHSNYLIAEVIISFSVDKAIVLWYDLYNISYHRGVLYEKTEGQIRVERDGGGQGADRDPEGSAGPVPH